jgi:hypothetical protein
LVKEKKNGTMPLVVFVAEAVSGLLIDFSKLACDPTPMAAILSILSASWKAGSYRKANAEKV